MKKNNPKSIGRVVLEYILIAPVFGGCANCAVAVTTWNYGVDVGLLLVIGTYVGLAGFYDLAQTRPLRIYPISYYLVLGFVFLTLFLITLGYFLYAASLTPVTTGEFPSDTTVFGSVMVATSCIFGPLSGLITIFVTQIIRVRRLQQDDPFERADSGNS